MTVPRVHRDWVSGERTVWDPKIVDVEEGAKSTSRAGSKITGIIRSMGGTANEVALRAVVGRGFSRQITAALSNGLVQEITRGVFAVVSTK